MLKKTLAGAVAAALLAGAAAPAFAASAPYDDAACRKVSTSDVCDAKKKAWEEGGKDAWITELVNEQIAARVADSAAARELKAAQDTKKAADKALSDYQLLIAAMGPLDTLLATQNVEAAKAVLDEAKEAYKEAVAASAKNDGDDALKQAVTEAAVAMAEAQEKADDAQKALNEVKLLDAERTQKLSELNKAVADANKTLADATKKRDEAKAEFLKADAALIAAKGGKLAPTAQGAAPVAKDDAKAEEAKKVEAEKKAAEAKKAEEAKKAAKGGKTAAGKTAGKAAVKGGKLADTGATAGVVFGFAALAAAAGATALRSRKH